jgi:Na+-transporting methylmalonyl-CoA/oxaloacetate decarboxylase gamma subunit
MTMVFLSDLLVGMGIGLGIILILSLVLWGLSEWAKRNSPRKPRRPIASPLRYPTISRADLDVEAANAECGVFPLSEHIRHRNKFEGRHYDAA